MGTGSLSSLNVTPALAGLPPADCEKLTTDSGVDASRQAAAKIENSQVRDVALTTLDGAARHCRAIAKIVVTGGGLATASPLLEKDRAAVEGDRARANALEEAYAAAKRSYDETALTLLRQAASERVQP